MTYIDIIDVIFEKNVRIFMFLFVNFCSIL